MDSPTLDPPDEPTTGEPAEADETEALRSKIAKLTRRLDHMVPDH